MNSEQPGSCDLDHPAEPADPYVAGRRGIPAWIREAVIDQIFVDRFAPDPGLAFEDPGDLAGSSAAPFAASPPASIIRRPWASPACG